MSSPARGAHLLDAVLRVVADEGLAGVSIRTVAVRAGVSPAQVQYYFRTREELVAAAFEHAGGQFLDALGDVAAQLDLRRLRAVVDQWLPLDNAREQRARVWLAFAGAAATDQRLARDARRTDEDLRSWFAAQLVGLQQDGSVRSDLDGERAAAHLLALIDGVVVHMLVVPRSRRRAMAEPLDQWWADVSAARERPHPAARR